MEPIKPGDNNDMFDRMFRDGLRNHEVAPGAGMWDKIEQGLEPQPVKPVAKDRGYLYYVALFLLIPVAVSFLLLNTGQTDSTLLGLDDSSNNTPANNTTNSSNTDNPSITQHTFNRSSSFATDNATELIDNGHLGMIGVYQYEEGKSVEAFANDNENSSELTAMNAVNNADRGDKKSRREQRRERRNNEAVIAANDNTDLTDGVEIDENISITRSCSGRLPTVFDEDGAINAKQVFRNERAILTGKSNMDVTGFSFGVFTGWNTNKTHFKSGALYPTISKNMRRVFSGGMQYGVSIGYDISPKFGIYTEYIMGSHQVQKYEDLRGGKLRIEGEIDLDYVHFPLLFKNKWTRISGRTNLPMAFNLVSGVQYSRLQHATVNMNESAPINIDNMFSKNQLGLIMGLEYDMFVHENYYLTLGTRASVSTDVKLPETNGRTYNFMLGVSARINYHIKTKRN